MDSARRPMPAACDARTARQATREGPLAVVDGRADVDARRSSCGSAPRPRRPVSACRRSPRDRRPARTRTSANSRWCMIQSPKMTGAGSCAWMVITSTDVMVPPLTGLPSPRRRVRAPRPARCDRGPGVRPDGDVEPAPLAGRQPQRGARARAPSARPRMPQVAGSRPVRYMPGPSIRHCHRCGSWRGSSSTVTAMPSVGAYAALAMPIQVPLRRPVAQPCSYTCCSKPSVGRPRTVVLGRQAGRRRRVARHHVRIRRQQHRGRPRPPGSRCCSGRAASARPARTPG